MRRAKYRVKKRAAARLSAAGLIGRLADGDLQPARRQEDMPPMPAVESQAAIIRDAQGQTIGALRADDELPPASLTKLLTAWTVYKHCPDLEQQVVVRAGTLIKLSGTGASTAGLVPNETITLRELLAALLRPSGADAALVLAEHTSGSEKDFVRLMNEEAQALGMTHSHFANAIGLDDSEQYSTAADLMRLWQAVLSEDTLKAIVTVEGQHTRWPSTLLTYDTPLDWSGGASWAARQAIPSGRANVWLPMQRWTVSFIIWSRWAHLGRPAAAGQHPC